MINFAIAFLKMLNFRLEIKVLSYTTFRAALHRGTRRLPVFHIESVSDKCGQLFLGLYCACDIIQSKANRFYWRYMDLNFRNTAFIERFHFNEFISEDLSMIVNRHQRTLLRWIASWRRYYGKISWSTGAFSSTLKCQMDQLENARNSHDRVHSGEAKHNRWLKDLHL